jgi:mono/diheme cytochrome c family protein
MIDSIYQALAKISYTHPLHPALTHLPVGLVLGGTLFAIFAGPFRTDSLAQTGGHCMILAFLGLIPTVLAGYVDWQHFYGGTWLFPIKMKMLLAGALMIFLLFVIILRRRVQTNMLTILPAYGLCFFTVIGLGYFGGELVYATSGKTEAGVNNELAQKGSEIFNQRCSACHFTDKTDTKVGPGLLGLFSRENLPASGKTVSDANIRSLLKTPIRVMPAFTNLSAEQTDALIEYLKTL